MYKYEKEPATARNRRDFLLNGLGLAGGALLCPLIDQVSTDQSRQTQAIFNEEAFTLWSNRLVGPAVSTKGKPQPEEAAFFYYTREKGFLAVEFDIDGQTDLGKMLPDTTANMKLAVNIVRPNHEHLDYIKHNKNGTLAISVMALPQAATAKSESTPAKTSNTGDDKASDHLIASLLPEVATFDYRISYPKGPSLVSDGVPLQAGIGNWAWTFSVQEKAPEWHAFITELQAAIGGQDNTGGNPGNKTQPGGKAQPKKTSPLDQAVKILEGGVGSWETLSFLGVGLKVFNSVIGKTMAKTGKPNVLLTLPNYQIITSKTGRQAAAGIAMPVVEGEYVAVPINQANLLENAGKMYELYEGVIVPAGSKDIHRALEETLLPSKGKSGPGLSYVSFSVKFI